MSVEENKATVRRYFEEFHNRRQHDAIAEILSQGLIESTESATRAVATAFPDYQITIVDQVAEGDRVATVWRMVGTHQGGWASPIGNIPPTGKRVEFGGTTTLRVTDGKISDVIGTNWDHLGILQQLGTVESMAPRPGA